MRTRGKVWYILLPCYYCPCALLFAPPLLPHLCQNPGAAHGNCAKVRELIELPFGVVSGVGPRHWCIRWDPHPLEKWMGGLGGFWTVDGFLQLSCPLVLMAFLSSFERENVFDLCVKSLQYFCWDNIRLEALFNPVTAAGIIDSKMDK